MLIVTPIFRIADYQQAVAFYIDWLGFRIDWEDRPANGPLYMQVSRGSIVLHLAAHEAERDSCGSMAIAEVNGLFALHRNLLQRNPPCSPPNLERTTWSDKVMQTQVTDPFGNRLVFVEACA